MRLPLGLLLAAAVVGLLSACDASPTLVCGLKAECIRRAQGFYACSTTPPVSVTWSVNSADRGTDNLIEAEPGDIVQACGNACCTQAFELQ